MELTKRELSLIGASIYLCEGTKPRIDNRGGSHFDIDFTNKDPRLISIFMKFLREVVGGDESKIKAQLFIYPDHDDEKLLNYWSKTANIPRDRFQKVIRLTQRNSKYKPNPLGTLKIRYPCKERFLKVQGIIGEIFGEGVY